MRTPWLFELSEFSEVTGALLSLAAVGLQLIAVLSLSFMANLYITDTSGKR